MIIKECQVYSCLKNFKRVIWMDKITQLRKQRNTTFLKPCLRFQSLIQTIGLEKFLTNFLKGDVDVFHFVLIFQQCCMLFVIPSLQFRWILGQIYLQYKNITIPFVPYKSCTYRIWFGKIKDENEDAISFWYNKAFNFGCKIIFLTHCDPLFWGISVLKRHGVITFTFMFSFFIEGKKKKKVIVHGWLFG